MLPNLAMFTIPKSSLMSVAVLAMVIVALLGCTSERETMPPSDQPVAADVTTVETIAEIIATQEPIAVDTSTADPDTDEIATEEPSVQEPNLDDSAAGTADPEASMEDVVAEDQIIPFEIEEDTVWLDVSEQLSASEQSCIEGLSSVDDLDANLERRLTSIIDEDSTEVDAAVDASIYGCLNRETANRILTEVWLISLLDVAEGDDELVESCVRDVLSSVDMMRVSFSNPDPQVEAISEAETFGMAFKMDLCWNLPPASELDVPQGEIVWHNPAGRIVLELLSEDAIYGLDYTTPFNSIVAIDRMNGEVLWRYEFGVRANHDRDPHIFTLVDGVLYASNNDLHAIDASSGRLLWEHRDKGHPENLVVSSGMAYYFIDYYVTENGDEVEALLAADAMTGEVLWTYEEYPYADNQSFAVGDGVVYVGRTEDDLIVLDSRTGQRVSFDYEPLWHDSRQRFGFYDRKIVDGVVYWLYESGLQAEDALTGEKLWKYDAELGTGGKARIEDGYAYLWSPYEGSISAIDLSGNEIVWSYQSENSHVGLTFSDGIAYFLSLKYSSELNRVSGQAYAVDATTADLLWEFQATNAPFYRSPTVDDGVVYVGGKGLYALDAVDGELLWYYLIDLTENSPPLAKDGVVYAADLLRGVYGLKAPRSE